MAINTKYYTKTALTSIVRNGLMSIASILTVACCLFLFSLFFLFTVNLNYIGAQVQAQCELQAFIDINLSDAEALAVYEDIKEIPGIRTAVFESKDEAFNNYLERMGNDRSAMAGLEGEDFLRCSVKVTLDDLSMAQQMTQTLSSVPGVADVSNRQDIVDNVLKVTSYIQNGSLIIMLILTIVSLFIISNTIKLSVNARADEIHIMKYVGATNWFIRWPFIIEGILVGIIASIPALAVVCIGYASVYSSLAGFMDVFKIYSLSDLGFMLVSLVVLFGCAMGAGGSIISIRKHLKV